MATVERWCLRKRIWIKVPWWALGVSDPRPGASWPSEAVGQNQNLKQDTELRGTRKKKTKHVISYFLIEAGLVFLTAASHRLSDVFLLFPSVSCTSASWAWNRLNCFRSPVGRSSAAHGFTVSPKNREFFVFHRIWLKHKFILWQIFECNVQNKAILRKFYKRG